MSWKDKHTDRRRLSLHPHAMP